MNLIEKILTEAPPEAWFGLFGVVVGFLGGLLGTWLTSRNAIKQMNIQLEHERSTKRKVLKREKFEELYNLVDKWLICIFSNCMHLRLVMEGKIDYNAYLDKVIEDGKEYRKYDFIRIEMIVNIYGEELLPSYNKILEIREELNSIADEFKNTYKTGNLDYRKYLKPYDDAHIKINQLGDIFKKEIAEYARNI